MRVQRKKVLLVFFPFLILILTFLVIRFLSEFDSNPLDATWTLRQLILGLFIFTSFSFIPRFIQLYFLNSFPWVSVNLSHHRGSLKSHELKYKNHSFCTGCTGSVISILIANSCLILYFYIPSIFSSIDTSLLFLTGVFLILVTYCRYFTEFSAILRVIQHSALFLGISLLIIAEDIVFQSALFIVLLLPTWVSFLLVRVKLSGIDHREN